MPDVLKTVGRYEILREVGRGGMAMVYLARQTDLDRFVALKELAAFHASDASFAQRFLRESRVAGSLSHPNIVTVHDYFEHDGTPYIAMEYVERGSLRPFVGKMTAAQIGGVLEGLLAGLALAEHHGIVHRDLKPENLMVTADGRVKIADFGIAKATKQMQTGAFLTATGTTVGTPTYMAPEQAMAQDIGPWTDLYSVGCMAFEMFTGRVPFHDSDAPMAILLRHVNEEIPSVKSIVPEVDQGISDWIEQLLVKDPKERTQSAGDAWDELEELVIGLLGPRWRRSARLSERAEQLDTPKPLTPAPFEGTSVEPASDEFQSFAWGQPVEERQPPGPDTPPPADAPAGPLQPGPIDVPTGPPTPPPLEPVAKAPPAPAEPAEPAAPPAEAAAPGAEAAAPAAEAAAPAAEAAAPGAEAAAPPAEAGAPPAESAAPGAEAAAPPAKPAAPPAAAAAPPAEAAAPGAEAAAPGAEAAAPAAEAAAPAAEAAAPPAEESGFLTFGAPAPADEASEAAAPPAEAAEPPKPAAEAAAPPASQPAEAAAPRAVPPAEPPIPAEPVAEPPASQPAEESGFLTFGAPAPPADNVAEPPVAVPAKPADNVAEPPAVPAEPADKVAEPPAAVPAEDSGFMTFGAPAPPADAAAPAPPAQPPAEEVAEPPQEIIGAHGTGAGAPAGEARFETYNAPPPPRPPVEEPPVAPPPREPEPEPEPIDEGDATVMPEALKRAPEPAPAPAKPRREPKPPREPRERRSKAFPIALGVGLILAIVAGFALGGGGDEGGGGEQTAGVPVTDASAGAVAVKVPEGYAEMTSLPAMPGLELANAAAYSPGGEDGGRAVAFGQTDASDSTLLPSEFRRALGLGDGEVPDRTPVKLGPEDLQAYRYENLEPAGSSRLVTVYASPTSKGVATVACLAPPADAEAFKRECEGIADTLQIASGKPFPVGPDPAYGKLLDTTFDRLERQVASGRRALARDGAQFRAQAAAARDIQAAYGGAAKRLRGAEVSPANTVINAALVKRLRASAAAWKQAGDAASGKQKRAFARASNRIAREERRLERTLQQLERIGYARS